MRAAKSYVIGCLDFLPVADWLLGWLPGAIGALLGVFRIPAAMVDSNHNNMVLVTHVQTKKICSIQTSIEIKMYE